MAQKNKISELRKEIQDLKIEHQKSKNKQRQADEETKNRLKKHDEEIKAIQHREIRRLLEERNLPISNRFRYTYEEIANELNCSPSTVSNVAREYGLSRRMKAVD